EVKPGVIWFRLSLGSSPDERAGFHPLGSFRDHDSFETMRTKLLLKPSGVLDERNASHIKAAQKWLEQGNAAEACKEIRMIQRIFASHPAVIRLRQHLVAVLCGWDQASGTVENQTA